MNENTRIFYDTYTVPVIERSSTNEFKEVLPKSECSEKKYSIRVWNACEDLRKSLNKLAYNPNGTLKIKLELIESVAKEYDINCISLRRIILGEE